MRVYACSSCMQRETEHCRARLLSTPKQRHVASLLEFLYDAVPASVYLSIYQAIEVRGPETAAWALLELEAVTPEENHDVHKQMAVALRNLFVLRLGGGRFIPLPHFKWAISACFQLDRDLRSKLLLAHHHLFRPDEKRCGRKRPAKQKKTCQLPIA